MKLIEYLGGFSVEDLRELARRRGIPLRQEALRDRQTLLRTLSASLGTYDAVHAALGGLNQAELGALQLLLGQARPGIQALAREFHAEPADLRVVLDQLRLWGLVFPEGNWDHIGIPACTQILSPYLSSVRANAPVPALSAPALVAAKETGLEPRPGSLAWDLAEFLARVARTRLKLTQKGQMNRRDLRSMEAAFSVQTPGYADFLYQLALTLRLVGRSHDGLVEVSEDAEGCLGAPEEHRTRGIVESWVGMRGYPEGSTFDPAEADYVPHHTFRQRGALLSALRATEDAFSVSSAGKRLHWLVPRAFEQWEGNRSAEVVAQRLVRSLCWLGLTRVDDLTAPTRAQLTVLGRRLLGEGGGHGELIPEEPRFFLQPNAETFSPPNLAPRTLYHLRRITGEKKGGPAGVYPLTQESLRRALDSGLTAPEITRFLERFSRTGLPDNVRQMVEGVGRQHGRIRLVPAEFVLLTDEPALLQELRSLKPIQPLLGRPLTERSATVGGEDVTEVLRRLRARGYAPLDELAGGVIIPLPDDPDLAPELPEAPASFELDWSHVEAGGEAAPETPGEVVTSRRAIRELLEQAEIDGLVVEIEYQARSAHEPGMRSIQPYYVEGYEVEAYCRLRHEIRHFAIPRILSARLTGETFEPPLF